MVIRMSKKKKEEEEKKKKKKEGHKYIKQFVITIEELKTYSNDSNKG